MPVKTYLASIHDGLEEAMAQDPTIVLLGEDIGPRGGVFGATAGLFARFGPDRVIDTPLAEGAIVGVAIGMAMNGFRPVVEIQFVDFILPAVDQIVSEAAKIRYRSNNDFHCPIVIRAPYGGGVHGALYHSQSLEAMFAHVPGLKVVVPSDPHDAKGLLHTAIADEDPVLFFEHKAAYRRLKGEVPDGPYEVPIGQAEVKRPGRDVTVVAYGLVLQHALAAAEELAGRGIDCEVIDLRSVLPLDVATVVASVRKTGRLLIAHEDHRILGVGSEVAAAVAEEALFDLDAPIRRLGAPFAPAMPYNPAQEQVFLLDAAHIAREVEALAQF